MAKITVKPLTTSNTTPTLTGTVEFERFDTQGNPKHTIQVVVNYNTYKLFDGNLGLDETKTPNIWKLHFSEPLYANYVYDVEAQVIDISTNTVIASDDSYAELTITNPPVQVTQRQSNMNLLQKIATVSLLMNSLNRLFGGQNGIGDNPSVHPVKDDDSSTSLSGRADEERNEDPRVKDKKARQAPNKIPLPPKKHNMDVTAGDAGEPGFSGASGDILAEALKPEDAPKMDEADRLLAEAQAQRERDAADAIDDASMAAAPAERAKLVEMQQQDAAIAAGATPASVGARASARTFGNAVAASAAARGN
jgi:hypothetical protein